MLGFRTRLVATVLLVVVGGVMAAGVYLFGALRSNMYSQARLEMGKHSRLAAVFVDQNLAVAEIGPADAMADRLGRASGMRVTIVTAKGVVLGDSALTRHQVKVVQNHKNRPEIRRAVKSGDGRSIRFSTTMGGKYVYAATRLENTLKGGVVRVSRPLTEVQAALKVLQRTVMVGALILLSFSGFVAVVLATYFSRLLEDIAAYGGRLASGNPVGEMPVGRAGLGGLTKSLGALQRRVASTLDKLATERNRFFTVLDGLNDAVIAIDEDGRVQVANRSSVELLGLSRSPLGSMLVECVRHPRFLEMVERLGRDGAVDGEFTLGEMRVLTIRGSQLAEGLSVMVLTDVTALRRLEQVRRDFVANVSHELRTPVSVMRANAETLAAGALNDPKVANRFLDSIVTNGERLSNLIADLLDLTRLEEGRAQLNPIRVQLGQVVERVCAGLETEIRSRDQELSNEVDPSLVVLADEPALEQVIFNLLDNAQKYAGQGAHLAVSAGCDHGFVTLSIADDGPGIPEVHRTRIFERFYRVDKGRSRQMGGTGLGLSIVKHLVGVMGGKVGVDSGMSAKGTTFTVWLPDGASTDQG